MADLKKLYSKASFGSLRPVHEDEEMCYETVGHPYTPPFFFTAYLKMATQ